MMLPRPKSSDKTRMIPGLALGVRDSAPGATATGIAAKIKDNAAVKGLSDEYAGESSR
jgi:hypothetical protein